MESLITSYVAVGLSKIDCCALVGEAWVLEVWVDNWQTEATSDVCVDM